MIAAAGERGFQGPRRSQGSVGPIGARPGARAGAEDLPLPEVPAGWRGRGRRDRDADDGQLQAGDVLVRGEANQPVHPLRWVADELAVDSARPIAAGCEPW